MSLVRRVKSFSVKKTTSTELLKSNDPNGVKLRSPRPRKKKLTREKSASMEHVPLHIDLQRSELYVRQRTKIEEQEVDQEKLERRRKLYRDSILKKRQSQSYDEAAFSRLVEFDEPVGEKKGNFSKCLEEFNQQPVQLRRVKDAKGRQERMSRYKTFDVTKDLISDFDNGDKETVVGFNKPANFPVPEDEEVPVRLQVRNRQERPKTYSSTLSPKKKEDSSLIFKGVTKLEIDNEPHEIREKQTLRLFNGNLQILNPNGITTTLREGLSLKKGAKIIAKTELEMTDSEKTIYRLHFETAKDAKDFIEFEKSHHSPPSSSPFKNIAWSQLRKLLKKRSSRDLLESKGIIKNEPIFGNTLDELCTSSNPVPEVITRIVRLIEEPANITSLGLYRASANLAVMQNIRFEINCGRWDILEKHRSDVDVLTGTLKLFFRELKEPLISYEVFQQMNRAIMTPTTKDEISHIVNHLPKPHKDTLLFIINHLLNVCRHKEENKMDFHNIAICWGPSLITLPDNCTDLVTQTTEFTQVTENLLNYYHHHQKPDPSAPAPPNKADFVLVVTQKLTKIIEANLEVEGIYRKSGSNTKIDKMMKVLEKQSFSDQDFFKSDIHDICCVLKKFLAGQKEALIPDDFFYRYCDICDIVEENALRDEVGRMVGELPKSTVLLVLIEHLNNVVRHEKKNKMSLNVLSDIWMTTLMANSSVLKDRKKMSKFSKLFQIFMNLNVKALPDVVAESGGRGSQYDNVPDDIHNQSETFYEKVNTKL